MNGQHGYVTPFPIYPAGHACRSSTLRDEPIRLSSRPKPSLSSDSNEQAGNVSEHFSDTSHQFIMEPAMPARHGITHYRTTESTRDEQNYRHSRAFLTLQPFHFLLGQSQREGELPTTLEPVTIAHMDDGLRVDEEKTTRLRAKLTARDGTPEG